MIYIRLRREVKRTAKKMRFLILCNLFIIDKKPPLHPDDPLLRKVINIDKLGELVQL